MSQTSKDLRAKIQAIFTQHEIDEVSISSLPIIVDQISNLIFDQREDARKELIAALQER